MKRLLFLLAVFFLVNGCSKVDGPVIGGDRDEHGCLGAAGYSYNQTIGACLREWELNPEQRKAAEIALADNELSTTIIQVNVMECEGCFLIYLQNNQNQEVSTIELKEWAKSSVQKFCGVSTNEPCETNDDCKAGGCSGHICQSASTPPKITTCEFKECYVARNYGKECLCLENKCQWS